MILSYRYTVTLHFHHIVTSLHRYAFQMAILHSIVHDLPLPLPLSRPLPLPLTLQQDDQMAILHSIVNDPIRLPSHFSAEASTLILKLLDRNPNQRIGSRAQGRRGVREYFLRPRPSILKLFRGSIFQFDLSSR